MTKKTRSEELTEAGKKKAAEIQASQPEHPPGTQLLRVYPGIPPGQGVYRLLIAHRGERHVVHVNAAGHRSSDLLRRLADEIRP